MMDARTEALDLIQNPLPREIILQPLTRVWELDAEIAKLQEQINTLMERRTAALDYAVKEQIAEDEHCRLDVKVRRLRSLDPAKFRAAFPEEFMTVCDVQRRELEEQMRHLGEKLSITLVDKLIKKPVLEAAPGVVTVKETVSYAVVLK